MPTTFAPNLSSTGPSIVARKSNRRERGSLDRARTRGNLGPDKRGGNHRSHQIDPRRELIEGWRRRTGRTARRRLARFEGRPDLDPGRPVLIDDCGTSTRMARMHGRAARGERCRAPVPHGHWKTTTFAGALRPSGVTAPMNPDGAALRACVEQVSVPASRAISIHGLLSQPRDTTGRDRGEAGIGTVGLSFRIAALPGGRPRAARTPKRYA